MDMDDEISGVPDDALDMLALGVRAYDGLMRNGIRSMSEVRTLTVDDLAALRTIGPSTAARIKRIADQGQTVGMDEEWAPGEPTPLAEMERVKLLARGYSTPLDDLVRQKQQELLDRISAAQAEVARQILDAGIDPAAVEIATEMVSTLGDPVVSYTVTARWKATGEPL